MGHSQDFILKGSTPFFTKPAPTSSKPQILCLLKCTNSLRILTQREFSTVSTHDHVLIHSVVWQQSEMVFLRCHLLLPRKINRDSTSDCLSAASAPFARVLANTAAQ